MERGSDGNGDPMKQPRTNRGVKPLLQLKIFILAQNPFPLSCLFPSLPIPNS